MTKARAKVTQVSFDPSADLERLEQLTKIALCAAEVDLDTEKKRRETGGNLSFFGKFQLHFKKKPAGVSDSLLEGEYLDAARLGQGSQMVKAERAAAAVEVMTSAESSQAENKYPYKTLAVTPEDLSSFTP